MAWVTIGENGLSGQGAKIVGSNLFDRDVIVLQKPTGYAFGLQTTTTVDPSWATAASKLVRIPSFAESSDTLHVFVAISSDNASGTTKARLYDNGSATAGAEQSTTGTAVTWKELTLTLGAWAGNFRTILVQFNTNNVAYTASCDADDVIGNMHFEAA